MFARTERAPSLLLFFVFLKIRCATVEMATAQRTRPRAVVGAPRRAAWQLKSAFTSQHQRSAAYKNYIFFTNIVGDFLFMNNNG